MIHHQPDPLGILLGVCLLIMTLSVFGGACFTVGIIVGRATAPWDDDDYEDDEEEDKPTPTPSVRIWDRVNNN